MSASNLEFGQFEKTFNKINNQIANFNVKTNEPTSSAHNSISNFINNVRDKYLAKIEDHRKKSLLKAKDNHCQSNTKPLNELVNIEFIPSIIK